MSNDTHLPDPFETLLITGATDGSHDRVTVQSDGAYLAYTPDPDYYGLDSFTYTSPEGQAISDLD